MSQQQIQNIKYVLTSRPEPTKKIELNFSKKQETIPLQQPDGHALIKVLQQSIDPAQLGWMKDRPSYIPPVQINEVMRSFGIGKVIQGQTKQFKTGDYVMGNLGWQQYCQVSDKSEGFRKVQVSPQIPLKTYMSILNHVGLTAHHGLYQVAGNLKKGETIVVSGAAGAVGSLVCQLAKREGLRVVAIAGSQEKLDWLKNDLKVDAVINYKTTKSMYQSIKDAAPNGVDLYWDNVGGEILDACMLQLNLFARIIICGAISTYKSDNVQGPKHYLQLLIKSAKMQGFIVFHYAHKDDEAIKDLVGLLQSGKLKSRCHVIEGGVDECPGALAQIFEGINIGKLVVEIAKDE